MSDNRASTRYFKFQVPQYGATWVELASFLIRLRNGRRGDLTYFLREAAAFAHRALGDRPLDQLEPRLNELLPPGVVTHSAPDPVQEPPMPAPREAPGRDGPERHTSSVQRSTSTAPSPAVSAIGTEADAQSGDSSDDPGDPQDTLRGYFH